MRAHVLVLAFALGATALLVVAAAWIGRQLPRAPQRERMPPTRNALLRVPPPPPDQPRPVVVAWEDGRALMPSFVLYEGGSWIRHTESSSSSYVTGELPPDEAGALHARFVAAGIDTMPPYVRLHPTAVDLNVVTICVAQEGAWSCASVEGVDPPRRDGAGPLAGAFPASELPSELARGHSLLAVFDDSSGRAWTSMSAAVVVSPLDDDDVAAPVWDGPPAPWPERLAPLRVDPGGPSVQRVSRAEADAIEAHLEALGDRPLRVAGQLATISSITPYIPAGEHVHALRRAFDEYVWGVQR